jgi:hypothetical protein
VFDDVTKTKADVHVMQSVFAAPEQVAHEASQESQLLLASA